jgi:hypothetical protein
VLANKRTIPLKAGPVSFKRLLGCTAHDLDIRPHKPEGVQRSSPMTRVKGACTLVIGFNIDADLPRPLVREPAGQETEQFRGYARSAILRGDKEILEFTVTVVAPGEVPRDVTDDSILHECDVGYTRWKGLPGVVVALKICGHARIGQSCDGIGPSGSGPWPLRPPC